MFDWLSHQAPGRRDQIQKPSHWCKKTFNCTINQQTKGQEGHTSFREQNTVFGAKPRDFDFNYMCRGSWVVTCCHWDHGRFTQKEFANFVQGALLTCNADGYTQTLFLKRRRGGGDGVHVCRRFFSAQTGQQQPPSGRQLPLLSGRGLRACDHPELKWQELHAASCKPSHGCNPCC